MEPYLSLPQPRPRLRVYGHRADDQQVDLHFVVQTERCSIFGDPSTGARCVDFALWNRSKVQAGKETGPEAGLGREKQFAICKEERKLC